MRREVPGNLRGGGAVPGCSPALPVAELGNGLSGFPGGLYSPMRFAAWGHPGLRIKRELITEVVGAGNSF